MKKLLIIILLFISLKSFSQPSQEKNNGWYIVGDTSFAWISMTGDTVFFASKGKNFNSTSIPPAVISVLGSKAPLLSPAFTGTPTGIGIPVYAQVTGSNATTTGQSLVNITGLSVPLTTNAIYEFEAIMTGSTTAVTTGTAYGVNYSAAGAAVEASITGSSTATATKTLRINALNTATSLYLAGSGQTGGILIKGRITTGANAGDLTIQHLKLTSGTSTIFIGSILKVTRIN